MSDQPAAPVRLAVRALRPFWVLPAAWCLAAVAAGIVVPEIDAGVSSWFPFFFHGGADGARTVLATIAGAMISVTGLVFSITIVVLQLASSQFSPRVLQTFLDDRVTQNTLGVFAASFVYSLTVLRSVSDRPGSTVPQLGVTLSFLLVLAAVAMFLGFIHHVTQAISVSTVIRQVADETRDLLGRAPRGGRADRPGPVELPDLPRQGVVAATRSGYVDVVDAARLCELATARDVRVELVRGLGDFVCEGAPLAVVRSRQPVGEDERSLVHRGVVVRRVRSMDQDVSFGLRRLVDIAERALSPGTNDPTTATQVLDEVHDILGRLARVPDPDPLRCDADGIPRVVLREHTFSDLLDLAVDEVAHWGADGLQTPARLAELLAALEPVALEEHRPTLAAKAHQVAGLPGRRGGPGGPGVS